MKKGSLCNLSSNAERILRATLARKKTSGEKKPKRDYNKERAAKLKEWKKWF